MAKVDLRRQRAVAVMQALLVNVDKYLERARKVKVPTLMFIKAGEDLLPKIEYNYPIAKPFLKPQDITLIGEKINLLKRVILDLRKKRQKWAERKEEIKREQKILEKQKIQKAKRVLPVPSAQIAKGVPFQFTPRDQKTQEAIATMEKEMQKVREYLNLASKIEVPTPEIIENGQKLYESVSYTWDKMKQFMPRYYQNLFYPRINLLRRMVENLRKRREIWEKTTREKQFQVAREKKLIIEPEVVKKEEAERIEEEIKKIEGELKEE